MYNVIPMPKGKMDYELVSNIESLLKEANSGNVEQLMYIGFLKNGNIMECIATGNCLYELLGGLTVVSDRITAVIRESVEECAECE